MLSEKGYEYYSFVESAQTPQYSELGFEDLISFPENVHGHLAFLKGKKLYKHQHEALSLLRSGFNVILKAGTGSGKTESWVLYALMNKKRVLTLYPTLALANDQVRRLKNYSENLGYKVFLIDSSERTRLSKEGYTPAKIRKELSQSNIVVTNPAFLLMDLKRAATRPSRSVFLSFLRTVDLVVVDEFDFYGPRELSLLLSMLEIISQLADEKPQIAILTATISNPEELCEILHDISLRECKTVDGSPFRRENRVIVVLGKNLKKLYEEAREYLGFLKENHVGEDILRALESYEEFKKSVYKVVEALRALGIEISSPSIDVVEILREYIEDEGVTVVFTRSIAKAEEIHRKLKYSLPNGKRELVASHHHLISKQKRYEIEERARRGEVKVVVSPRTLSQGIDIGTITRIVHIGLPSEVREYNQREGRKGRREEIEFTETIIIPGSKWDRELLSRGVDVFKDWLRLPIEITPVNSDNKYGKMFLALFKFKSGQRLSPLERKLLESLGLLRDNALTRRGERAWYNINFYEFAPPFGIKRVFIDENGERVLEDISFSDLVEKFQVGCIDYSSDGIVSGILLGGKSGRSVRRVIVSKLRESLLYGNDALSYAIEEYRKIKIKWGEKPSIFHDYVRGRLKSEAICNVIPPTSGFGMYVKIPYKVVWIVEGEGGKLVETSVGTIVLKNRRVIEVPSMVAGRYTDYSYGRVYELNPREKFEHLRLGLATLSVFLREKYRLPLGIISYSLSSVGGRKTLILWEEESAGLIEKISWEKIYNDLREYKPSKIAEILLLQQDEEAHLTWLSMGGRWDIAIGFAENVVEYILLSEKIKMVFGGREIFVPKPGRHLKMLSMDVIVLPLTEDGDVSIGYVGFFDGENFYIERFLKEFYRQSGRFEVFQGTLVDLVNKGFDIIVYDIDRVREELHSINLTFHAALLGGLVQLGKVHDLSLGVEKMFNRKLGLEELLKALNMPLKYSLAEISNELVRSRNRIKNQPMYRWYYFTKFLEKKAREYLESSVRNIYRLYFALKTLEGESK